MVAMLLAGAATAQVQNIAPQSPYGGSVVEDVVAHVNNQIITRSDYDRALREIDQEARQRGATTMQEISAGHRDLLRNLIDQQLWLSKGKELGINGDTELIKRLDSYRKQYHLETLEDLEKAAKEQGVSFEDFKANIRNGIITQQVMQQQVGGQIRFTPGEAERYYEKHKAEYAQPESVVLSEILVSTGGSTDAAKLAAAKAKADDIEARIHAGGDFSQLAKSFSDGPTGSAGGDLGQYQRGALSKVLEDKTFALQAGQVTEPILTRQGYVILKVNQHAAGGAKPYKEVQQQVEEAFYMERMEPAIRAYLTKMREEAYIDIKPGYTDTGASVKETKPVYSAYVPPSPKKKKKIERTRFRETAHSFRQKGGAAVEEAATPAPVVEKATAKGKKNKNVTPGVEKPGKKEKIRLGQKPRATLPESQNNTAVENAGALPENANASADTPVNPLEPTAPAEKSRFSSRARVPKQPKAKLTLTPDSTTQGPEADVVADRQTQAGPLGLAGDTSKKKKQATATGDKTRLSQKKKTDEEKQTKEQKQEQNFTPLPTIKGAPAPADHKPVSSTDTQQK
ncbi:MAG: peptidylprolyl isomerase [Terracidiphilus sp.]|nr:peptidylprolyl isomerase [Terracidiphilus sp.]